MLSNGTGRLAVLIDAENISAKYAVPLFEEIAKLGEASVRRLYCDVQSASSTAWLELQPQLGLVPVHQPKNTVGKNASDIALVVDAMDLMHSGRFDGFVLVSSDSDFTRLAQRLREEGLDVVGMGEQKTPLAFRMACKLFITVENLTQSASTAEKPKGNGKGDGPDLNTAYQMISNAAADTNDPEGWAGLAFLGQQLTKRYPDFDARSFGYKRLSELIRAINRFEETGEGADHKIRPRS